MQSLTLQFKQNYSNSFLSSLVIIFITFFICLWIFFFLNYTIAIGIIVAVILFLFYWNMKTDGSINFEKNAEATFINSSELSLNEPIKNIQFGWNYAFVNHGKAIIMTDMVMNPMQTEQKQTSNTNQLIAFLELENGQNIVLIKELMPWQEVDKLPYIGYTIDTSTIHQQCYIKGRFSRLQRFFNAEN